MLLSKTILFQNSRAAELKILLLQC